MKPPDETLPLLSDMSMGGDRGSNSVLHEHLVCALHLTEIERLARHEMALDSELPVLQLGAIRCMSHLDSMDKANVLDVFSRDVMRQWHWRFLQSLAARLDEVDLPKVPVALRDGRMRLGGIHHRAALPATRPCWPYRRRCSRRSRCQPIDRAASASFAVGIRLQRLSANVAHATLNQNMCGICHMEPSSRRHSPQMDR